MFGFHDIYFLSLAGCHIVSVEDNAESSSGKLVERHFQLCVSYLSFGPFSFGWLPFFESGRQNQKWQWKVSGKKQVICNPVKLPVLGHENRGERQISKLSAETLLVQIRLCART